MSTYIISFDCGVKNFAYSIILLNDFNKLVKEPITEFFDNNKYQIINIKNVSLYNVKTDDKFSYHSKAVTLLMSILEKLDQNIPIKILIEYQLGLNHKTNIIYNIILTFFETYYKISNKKNYEIITIKPCYKIKLSEHVDSDNKIRIKFINQYKYNKRIVEVYFLQLNEKYKFIDLGKKNKIDDIADSFIQILSYIYLLESV